MDCPQYHWLSDKEYLRQFNRKVVRQRIPLSGGIDLTHQCNLRCVHCYIGPKREKSRNDEKELNTSRWISIIDQISEAGCLHFLITGGEPLLREDFGDIYRHAKTNGLLVTVFTNGTMVTDEIINLFRELPPHAVEISLYGATAATYENITGIKGSFDKCLSGIEKLVSGSVNVKLKTILMTLNQHEFYDIEKMAEKYNVKFRFDPAIFPRFDGDMKPIDLRVNPKKVVDIEFSDENRKMQWSNYYDRMKAVSIPDCLYKCGSGLTSFHIDAYGNLQPCLMVKHLQYSLLEGEFLKGWKDVMPRIRSRKAGKTCLCNGCDMITLCGVCPPFSNLEKRKEDMRSEYLCALGKHRFQAINSI